MYQRRSPPVYGRLFVVSPAAFAAGVPRNCWALPEGRGIEDGLPGFGAMFLL
jgi:hypothetical protein